MKDKRIFGCFLLGSLLYIPIAVVLGSITFLFCYICALVADHEHEE